MLGAQKVKPQTAAVGNLFNRHHFHLKQSMKMMPIQQITYYRRLGVNRIRENDSSDKLPGPRDHRQAAAYNRLKSMPGKVKGAFLGALTSF